MELILRRLYKHHRHHHQNRHHRRRCRTHFQLQSTLTHL